MATATMTSKGQVTVPKEVRELLNLRAGDRLEFVRTTEGFLVKARNRSLDDVKGMLAGVAVPPIDEQEADEAAALRDKYLS